MHAALRSKNKDWSQDHKTSKYKFHTHTPQKSSNQNAVFIGYDILIRRLSKMSTKLILLEFYDHKALVGQTLKITQITMGTVTYFIE